MGIPRRFKIIRNNCKGKIIHLGSNNGERRFNLDNYLREKFKVTSVDIMGAPDIKQDLNKINWDNIDGKWDTVVAPEIMEHVANPEQFILNCAKLLNKGGRLILSTPNATSLIYLYNPE